MNISFFPFDIGFEEGFGVLIVRSGKEEFEDVFRSLSYVIQMGHSFGKVVGKFSVGVEFSFEHHRANSGKVDFILELVSAIFFSDTIGLQKLFGFVDDVFVFWGTFLVRVWFDVEVVVSQSGNEILLLRS